jgi:phage terminase large subunit-like protein
MTKAKAKDYVAIAARYAGDVVSGKIPACQWTIKACRRQLDDLERAKSDGFPYRFDRKKTSRICEFIELLPHIKGEWARQGKRIELQPWQVFILTAVFGWVSKQTGLRRFKVSVHLCPHSHSRHYHA